MSMARYRRDTRHTVEYIFSIIDKKSFSRRTVLINESLVSSISNLTTAQPSWYQINTTAEYPLKRINSASGTLDEQCYRTPYLSQNAYLRSGLNVDTEQFCTASAPVRIDDGLDGKPDNQYDKRGKSKSHLR
jgi:hypothetical protein